MAAQNANTALFFGAQNPTAQQNALAMMRAQMLAQQYQQSAENYGQGAQAPDPNQETRAGIGIPISKASGMARMLSAAMSGQQQTAANNQQLQAAQDQMQMMAQALQSQSQGSSQAGNAGSNNAINPQSLVKSAMYGNMYGDAAQKAYLDSLQPTPDQKNAAASGVANPVDLAGATTAAQQGSTVGKYTVGGNTDVPLTGAQALQLSQGANQLPPPPSFGVGGNLPPPLPQAVPNGAPVPPVAPAAQGTPLPPPTGYTQAGGPVASNMLSPAPVPASVPAIGPGAAPPAMAAPSGIPATTPPQVPFSQAVANAQQSMTPPAIGNSPVYAGQVAANAEAQKAAALAPITAQTAGATDAQKNVQTYREGLNKSVAEYQSQLPIINAQEDFTKLFQPGAGASQLAQAAAAAATAGASPQLQQQIARGDPGAVQAFDALASQHAAKQAETLMSNGGTGTPRIAQSVFESFKSDLSNPNKQANAIAAINALTRQQANMVFNEQQAAYADKGDPTTFQERYAATQQKALMAGRQADPQAAINQGSVQSQIPPQGAQQIGTKGGKPVYKLPDGRGWMPD